MYVGTYEFMCVHVHVEGRVEVRCLNLFLSMFLVETGSLTEPEACLFGTGWLLSLKGPPFLPQCCWDDNHYIVFMWM